MIIRYVTGSQLALLILLAHSPRLIAQTKTDKPLPPFVRVTGEGMITVPPDLALIQVGVVTQAETAQAASQENARRIDGVITDLRRVLGSTAEIKTVGYTLSPVYRYPKDGSKPTISGYSATNLVEVKVKDLQQVGRVLDVAAQGGANTIHSLQFGLKDDSSAQAEALRQAVVNARAKADTLASALGLHVIRVMSVEESGPVARPLSNQFLARQALQTAAVPTPVEPGTLELHASVTLTVELSQ